MTRRIGIEAQRILRPKRHGMDVVALKLVEHLLRVDHETEFFVYVDREDTENVLGHHPNLTKRVVKCPTYPLWEQVALPLAMQRDGIELAHFTSSTGPLLWGRPYVVTLHDVIFVQPEYANGGTLYQRLGSVYRRWVVPGVARRAEAVVTVSDYERERILEALPLPDEQVQVVHNGVGEPFVSGPPSDGPRPEVPSRFLLFLGNEAPKKNTRRVLAAFARLLEAVPGAPDLVVMELSRSRVAEMLGELGAEWALERIHCPGYVSHHELYHWYTAAEGFLYPSLAESFGLPVLEAMACGTPVVTSNVTSMPEVAGEAALLVDPTNETSLARALQRLCTEPTLREELARRGRERAASFSWEHAAQQTSNLYASLGARAA